MTRPEKLAMGRSITECARARSTPEDERDRQLLDAYYHERAMDAADDPRANTEAEQAEQDMLLTLLRGLPARDP